MSAARHEMLTRTHAAARAYTASEPCHASNCLPCRANVHAGTATKPCQQVGPHTHTPAGNLNASRIQSGPTRQSLPSPGAHMLQHRKAHSGCVTAQETAQRTVTWTQPPHPADSYHRRQDYAAHWCICQLSSDKGTAGLGH